MKPARSTGVLSMTGFGSAEGSLGAHLYRIEAKSVNHRFLDLKLRLPRELQSIDSPIKSLVQSRFSRGAIEIKVDRVVEGSASIAADLSVNVDLARRYQEKIAELSRALGLKDHVTTLEIASFPDVLTRGAPDVPAEETWKRFEPFVEKALDGLAEMRAHELDYEPASGD